MYLKIGLSFYTLCRLFRFRLYEKEDEDSPEAVKELKKQLHEKDMMLTDIRLDALSSAHQLENLKETVNKMRVSMDYNFSYGTGFKCFLLIHKKKSN